MILKRSNKTVSLWMAAIVVVGLLWSGICGRRASTSDLQSTPGHRTDLRSCGANHYRRKRDGLCRSKRYGHADRNEADGQRNLRGIQVSRLDCPDPYRCCDGSSRTSRLRPHRYEGHQGNHFGDVRSDTCSGRSAEKQQNVYSNSQREHAGRRAVGLVSEIEAFKKRG